MTEIDYCQRCLYSTDHPLGLTIDDQGICSGCRIHEEKDSLDWDYRWSLLEALVNDYRSPSPSTYDCIVPVTGGQDSYFILHLVKNRLKLNPLIVSYNKYWNTPLGIHNLANLRIQFNCDILIQNVNPVSVKKITRSTLRQLGSIYWHCIAGQTVFPVQTAVRYKIPLIIWGAHQGVEQSGMFSHEHAVEMTRRYRKDHDLMGMEADDLLSDFDTLTEGDIWQYRYPDDDELHQVGVRGIYLSHYVRWDPKAQHQQMIKHYQYKTARFARTFDCYDYVDCFNYMDIHDTIKWYKHGYAKVTDHACREIRHGRLSREQALKLVDYYQQQAMQYFPLFCEWLGVDQKGLNFVLDHFRNSTYWQKDENKKWQFRPPQQLQNNKVNDDTDRDLALSDGAHFIDNSSLLRDKHSAYITIGKGWP
ncbi:MAG: N-acetyl sugar amidotransferase [Pseudomonadota bacterium]